MKSLFVFCLVFGSAFASAACPNVVSYKANDQQAIDAVAKQIFAPTVTVENCTYKVQDIINADAKSTGGAPGISRTSIMSCDVENTANQVKSVQFFKIVRFEAIGNVISDGFTMRSQTCPSDSGNSTTVTISSITRN